MDAAERLGFVIAALHVVAPDLVAHSSDASPASATHLLEWAAGAGSVPALLAALSERQRDDLRRVLDGMLRDRALSLAAVAVCRPA